MKPGKEGNCGGRNQPAPFTGTCRENGRIASRLPTLTDPIERPAPMLYWQLDFKDASTGHGTIHTAKSNMW